MQTAGPFFSGSLSESVSIPRPDTDADPDGAGLEMQGGAPGKASSALENGPI